MMACKRFVLSICFLGALALPVAQAGESSPATSEQVTITDVQVRISDHGAVVFLLAEGKAIPIFVDLTVALSIQGALNGEKLSRPLSHDLMHTILEAYGGKVLRTVITLKGGTYYGALTVAMQDQVKTFDSRSSDSIALAVHFKGADHRGTGFAELSWARVGASRRRKTCEAYSFSIRARSRSRRLSVDCLMKAMFSPRCCSALILPSSRRFSWSSPNCAITGPSSWFSAFQISAHLVCLATGYLSQGGSAAHAVPQLAPSRMKASASTVIVRLLAA